MQRREERTRENARIANRAKRGERTRENARIANGAERDDAPAGRREKGRRIPYLRSAVLALFVHCLFKFCCFNHNREHIFKSKMIICIKVLFVFFALEASNEVILTRVNKKLRMLFKVRPKQDFSQKFDPTCHYF